MPDKVKGQAREAFGRAVSESLAAEGFTQKTVGAAMSAKESVRELNDRDSIEATQLEEALAVSRSDTLGQASGIEHAAAALLQDTDAILARLEVGIARESKAMDDLLVRLRKPAA